MSKVDKIGFGDLALIQDDCGFKYGIDAILLADFACKLAPTAKNFIDLGTGNGIIPLVISHKVEGSKIAGIDVQEKAIEIARKNVELNGLEDRIDCLCCDVLSLNESFPDLAKSADALVSNPPYFEKGSGIVNEKSAKHIARQETTAGIEDFISAAAWTLKDRGHFFIVHRPSRLVDIFYYCRKYKLEPKDIRFVAPTEGELPNIVLIHCVAGGGRELKFMKDLYVYNSNRMYTSEIMEIYEKTP